MNSSAATAPFVDAFRARSAEACGPDWLDRRREAALMRFAELGFPTRRQEAWRYNDLRRLTRTPILPLTGQAGAVPELPSGVALGEESHRVVFVDGRYEPALSATEALPPGAWLGSLAAALAERPDLAERAFDEAALADAQPFAALGFAFAADGFILALEPGVVLDRPVEIVHIGSADSAGSVHLRSAVFAGPESGATLVETYAGAGPGWTNAALTVDIGADADIRHAKLQAEASEAAHLCLTRATLARRARFASFTLTTGAALSREDIQVAVAGDDAAVTVDGAILLRGTQEATFAPIVEHRAEGCTTSETVRGVVDERGHGVFLGTIIVRPGADRTDARQINRNLLLGRQAAVDTKPELTILADDVACSHGATVGDLDTEALFYLRARGIDEDSARRMLIEAFVGEAFDCAAPGEAAARLFRRHLEGWLGGPEQPA